MQQMFFFKFHEIEDDEKKYFILKTLLREFKDVVMESRKVFDRFDKPGSCVDIFGTLDQTKNSREGKIPIPFKLVAMHEVWEKYFDWIVHENPFDESSEPKSAEKGSSKTHIDKIKFLV